MEHVGGEGYSFQLNLQLEKQHIRFRRLPRIVQRKPDRPLLEHVKRKHNSRVNANILTPSFKSVGYEGANNFRASGQQVRHPTLFS